MDYLIVYFPTSTTVNSKDTVAKIVHKRLNA